MPNILLSKFAAWLDQQKEFEDPSLVELLEDLGYDNILWMILSQDEIHLLEYSDSIQPEFIDSLKFNKNYEKIKEWMKNTLERNIIEWGNSSRTVLYVSKDNFQNIVIVVSDKNPEVRDADVRPLTRIAIEFIKKSQKVNTLENALRLTYGGSKGEDKVRQVSSITMNSIKPSFVKDVIPHVFYSFVHESHGPFIFESFPDEMKSPDYLITAVKLFSGLDADMVAEVGHVFKTDPIRKPVLGEIFSIVFTLPSPDARGKFEVHCISVVIPQEFFNVFQSLIGEFKTRLFMLAEKIRLSHEENEWSLAVDPMGENNSLREEITPKLETLRSELALTFALQMDPEDVLTW